jgi:ABC-2 type transport system permease protein
MSAPTEATFWPDGGRWAHFVHVTRALTTTEFKLRYFGSVLGYLWTLLRPLMLFAEATSGGLGSFVARENLLRKVYFPRAAVPISVSFTAAANLGLGILVVFLFAIINGVTPSADWLLFLGSVLTVVALATAASVLLAVLFVRYRDVQPIWEVALQLLFWGTPIIYTVERVHTTLRHLMMMNPLAVAIQQGRHWLSPSSTESAAQAIGGGVRLLIPLAIACAVMALAWWSYRGAEGRLAEDL